MEALNNYLSQLGVEAKGKSVRVFKNSVANKNVSPKVCLSEEMTAIENNLVQPMMVNDQWTTTMLPAEPEPVVLPNEMSSKKRKG